MRKRKLLVILLTVCMAICLLTTTVMAMQIFVRVDSSGETITLDVEPAETIESIKQKIQDLTGYSPEVQHLYYNDSLLSDSKTLADYNIGKETTPQLVIAIAVGDDWLLDIDGVLTISNDEGMNDWTWAGNGRRTYASEVKTVIINYGVGYIADDAFYDCSNLTSITIPDSVTSIGGAAFYNCSSLRSIDIPDGVTSIGDRTFSGCLNLTYVTIPSSVTSIGSDAFSSCESLTSITLPSGLTSIGSSAFINSGLTSVTIPSSVTTIEEAAFICCYYLESVEFEDGINLLAIEDSLFNECSGLTSISIPSSVTSIGNATFQNCISLTSVTIPSNVTSVANAAFYNCKSLETVTIESCATTIGSNAFYNTPALTNGNINQASHTPSGNGTVTKEATCTEDGEMTYTCSVCGDSYTEVIPATGHSYEAVVTDPTCTEKGYTTYTCSVCGDSYTANETEATGHTKGEAVIENSVDATCTTNGSYDEVVYCTICNAEVSRKTVTIDATGHSYEAVVTEPTCTIGGYTTYTCSVCGDSYTANETEATGHTWDEGTVTTAVTCTEDGEMTYTCTVCGDTYTEAISATGHSYGEPVFTWNGNTCTATFTCTEGDDEQTVDATVMSKNFFGMVTRTAEVTFGGLTYTDTKTTGRSLLTIMADYTSVNNAISKANALNASDYSNFADVTAAINAVQWNLNVLNQSTVNGYAEAIETAIANLKAAELTEETVTINEPIEDTNTETEPDDIEVDDTDEDQNPTTGIALAMLPMAIALAGVVINKRR